MKINYQPNPFLTTVEIDERDKQMMLVSYQTEQFSELLCDLHMQLNGSYGGAPLTDIEEIKKIVDKWADIRNLEVDSEDIRRYISYLDTEHMGDCTCVSCSCARCMAEELLGINTLQGLGKHPANKVQGAFGRDGNKTIDEAIATLQAVRDYIKPVTWPDSVGWDVHIPRWERERESALKWLKAYKEEHGF